jgi:pimeloyl-ACP methyl ester carboxylesterase
MSGKTKIHITAVRLISRLLAPFLLLGLLAGCSIPIGVARVSTAESYRQSTANPLNEGVPSTATRVVLQRYDLTRAATDDPVKAIRSLHETTKVDERRDILFALAELSYLQGERLQGSNSLDDIAHAPDYYLLSAVYAYLYLLGDGKEPPPSAWDVRFRESCDLYNHALAKGFPAGEDGSLTIGDRVRKFPVGELTIIPNVETLNWKVDQFSRFLPADNYEVFGFTVRNRTPGLGLPLIAVINQSLEAPNGGALPLTAFLRIDGGLKELGSGKATATLELYSAYDQAEVTVNGRTVPLETDSTAPLAYRLNKSEVWSLGLKRFLGSGGRIANPLLIIQPYEPGRIPVVFVHGTASSPVWWAEMINTLRADPVIRKRFQFWFFQYDSSNMILLSAANLRETLAAMVKQLDPQGKDPAMGQMVVIGHSQGGLLTKTTAVAPGDRIWNSISDQSIDEIDMPGDIREVARRAALFEPLPFVKRVVFISTPHRGSFLTTNWVRSLVRTIVSIPVDIINLNPQRLTQFTDRLKLPSSMRNRIPTSVDGMSWDNPVLQALDTLPLAPGVTGHSIIAVLPGMEIETGNDGVVEYKSAHLDGMESEFIVRFEHSCQGHPFTIEEVRRILHEHIGKVIAGPQRMVSPPPDSVPPDATTLPAATPASLVPASDGTTERK